METLQRTLHQDLTAAADGLGQQVRFLATEAGRLAGQQAADAAAVSNQVAALHSAIDRDHALVAEVDRRRAENERLQSDFQTLAASQQTLLAQAKLVANPPPVPVAVPGVKSSAAGEPWCAPSPRVSITASISGPLPRPAHQVARALAASPQPLRVSVIGHSDDDRAFGRWTRAWEASLARAGP